MTIADGKATMIVTHYFYEPHEKVMDRDAFLDGLNSLHLGEWHNVYSPQKYGCMVLDGTQWELTFSFTDGHKEKMYGRNLFPYNFDNL